MIDRGRFAAPVNHVGPLYIKWLEQLGRVNVPPKAFRIDPDLLEGRGAAGAARSWARSSAGEHYVDIVGVAGSIPAAPTTNFPLYQRVKASSVAIRGERKESNSTSIGPNLREPAANDPDRLAKNGPVCCRVVLRAPDNVEAVRAVYCRTLEVHRQNVRAD